MAIPWSQPGPTLELGRPTKTGIPPAQFQTLASTTLLSRSGIVYLGVRRDAPLMAASGPSFAVRFCLRLFILIETSSTVVEFILVRTNYDWKLNLED